MLDVHPPHKAARGWRDFLVHIATIAVGLLLALGLESFVEYLHHRHQLSAARVELQAEVEANRSVVKYNLAEARKLATILDANLKTLRSGPPADYSSLSFQWNVRWPHDSAWQVVQRDTSLQLMPREEVGYYVYMHETIEYEMRTLDRVGQQLESARAISQRAIAGPLRASDVEALIAATSEAKARVNYLTELLGYVAIGLERAGAHPEPAAFPAR
jgi:hypothetical protein